MKIKLQMSEYVTEKMADSQMATVSSSEKELLQFQLTPKYNIDVKQACISLYMSMLSIPFSMAVKNYENIAIIRLV